MATTSKLERQALEPLRAWSRREERKPLLLRGARQVGKSFLVRMLAEAEQLDLLEANLERHPALAGAFREPDPARILAALELTLRRRIHPARTLVFLDELQAVPQAFRCLRYFHEERPELRVIAAGSLLDLMLHEREFSVPVGRLEYVHLKPLTFEEFLRGRRNEPALEILARFAPGAEISPAEHESMMTELRIFVTVGGMPEVVSTYLRTGSYLEAEHVKEALLATLRDDFAKYRRRVPEERLRKVLDAVPRRIGSKLRYVDIDPGERSRDLSAALDLLCRALLVHRVHSVSGHGVPLGASKDERRFKVLLLDVGLVSTACGFDAVALDQVPDLLRVNEGALAEQFVGQELLGSLPHQKEPALHFWAREAKSSSAEVDYLVESGPGVVPVEVKAGRTGRLRSLHQYVLAHHPGLAIRLNSDRPSVLALGEGAKATRLLSLPLYLAGQVRRILAGGASRR
ncbi:MAG: ATP-binding protein [Candidatus Riflebacteria bacterium]|nr:ATP-binding protein [Candidatus Riflebacteria bacterium]